MARWVGLLRPARSGKVASRGGKTILGRRMGKNGRGGQEGRQGGRLYPGQRRAAKRNRKSFQAALRYRDRTQCRQSRCHRWENPAGVEVRRALFRCPYGRQRIDGHGAFVRRYFSSPRTGDDAQRNQRPEQLVGRPHLGGQCEALHLCLAGLSSREHLVQHRLCEARGDSFLDRPAESQMVRQDRLPRSAHSRRGRFDVVFSWKLKGEDYLTKLARQKLFVSRDQRVLAESLAKGKIAVVVGLSYYSLLPFIKAGLPVKSVPTPRDEVYVSGGSGNVTIIKGAPHPH